MASGPRTSCLIGKALADDTIQLAVCTIFVIAAERDAVGVAEGEFRNIALQVAL